jgi:uncharacterized membrane protein
MTAFVPLLAFALAWFAIHPGIAGSSLRWALVERMGEKRFRGLFSLLSAGCLTGLVWSYSRAPFYPLWFAPRAVFHVPLVIVPIAFVLFVGAFTVPNPTSVAAERVLARPEPARGVLRITRHPFLWAVALWGLAHGLVNGDVASLLFFGSLTATALVGTRDIDAKRQRTNPEEWEKYRSVTSNPPLLAILEGRNRLVLHELLVPIAGSALLTVILLWFHGRWFGASPLP